MLRFLFSSLLSHLRCSPLNSQGLFHASLSLSHPRPCPLPVLLLPLSSLSTPAPSPPHTSSDTPEHRTPVDLWIFPGSPLDLPFFPWTPISGSFLASLLLLLLFHLHLHTPASQSPHATLSRFYLRSPISPLASFHIDSSSLCHRLLSYSLNSTMTHSP